MIARIQKSMQEKDKGFTLIELLVVMIIIGILAAIAIPVFLNQRERAVDTGIKNDLRSIANEVESAFVDNQAYPDAATGTGEIEINGVEITLSHDLTAVEYTPDGNSYTITGVNDENGTGTEFEYDSAAGGLQD